MLLNVNGTMSRDFYHFFVYLPTNLSSTSVFWPKLHIWFFIVKKNAENMYLFVPIQAHSVKIFSSSRGLHSQWPPYSQANTIFWQTDENSQRYVFALFRQVSQRQPVLYLNLRSFLIALYLLYTGRLFMSTYLFKWKHLGSNA